MDLRWIFISDFIWILYGFYMDFIMDYMDFKQMDYTR